MSQNSASSTSTDAAPDVSAPDVSAPPFAFDGAPAFDWKSLRLPSYKGEGAAPRNANAVHDAGLSRIDRAAMWVTDRVGSVGFFLAILAWTILWTGYNIAATELGFLHWKAFDPFPAFVAYLLISNVIQILLMPLIMVGQNLQGRHTETRAQLDFEINQKAEAEVVAILAHLEHNTDLLLQLMRHLDCRVAQDEMRAVSTEQQFARKIAAETAGK